MIAAFIQLILGALMLGGVLLVKLNDVDEVIELATRRSKLKHWRRALITIALSLLGSATFLDPLIPGAANLTIRVPTGCGIYPGLSEHQRVKVLPLGLRGLAGGDRIADVSVGRDGSATVPEDPSYYEVGLGVGAWLGTIWKTWPRAERS